MHRHTLNRVALDWVQEKQGRLWTGHLVTGVPLSRVRALGAVVCLSMISGCGHYQHTGGPLGDILYGPPAQELTLDTPCGKLTLNSSQDLQQPIFTCTHTVDHLGNVSDQATAGAASSIGPGLAAKAGADAAQAGFQLGLRAVMGPHP